MSYQINRFVIDVPSVPEKTSTDQLDMDFFLQQDYRKVILGTVRFPNGKPAPCAVVKFFKPKHADCNADTTSELEPIGHAITDENGQFLLGPVYPGEKFILKILYMNGTMIRSTTESIRGTHEPEDLEFDECDLDECELEE